MRWLLRIFEKNRPRFEAGRRLSRLHPFFDAVEHFFFAGSARTAVAPHVRDPLDVKRFMSMVIVALVPCTLASLYFFGLRVLAMILVSYAAGGAVEVAFAIARKEEINEGFLVTGLLFPLVLPPTLPLWMVAGGVMFGVLVGKELFGGTGRNPFNPALVGRCFLAIAYPAAMSAHWIRPGTGWAGRLAEYVGASTPDALTGATPLVEAKRGALAGLWDMFLGRIAGSAGETSALAVLLGGGFLLLTRVANWRIVFGILLSFTALAVPLHVLGSETPGPVAWQLCAGGLLFGAFFMATDPVTCPASNGGKWAYGLLIGVLAALIRTLTGYVEGVMFAILLGNTAAPILDEVAIRHRLRRLSHER